MSVHRSPNSDIGNSILHVISVDMIIVRRDMKTRFLVEPACHCYYRAIQAV